MWCVPDSNARQYGPGADFPKIFQTDRQLPTVTLNITLNGKDRFP